MKAGTKFVERVAKTLSKDRNLTTGIPKIAADISDYFFHTNNEQTESASQKESNTNAKKTVHVVGKEDYKKILDDDFKEMMKNLKSSGKFENKNKFTDSIDKQKQEAVIKSR